MLDCNYKNKKDKRLREKVIMPSEYTDEIEN